VAAVSHWCFDDQEWTVLRALDRDEKYAACAVCDRPRQETLDERDTMRRRLSTLGRNLRDAANQRQRAVSKVDTSADYSTVFPCPHCGGRVKPWCQPPGATAHQSCEWRIAENLATLGRNLATAGALCASYWQGYRASDDQANDIDDSWQPGCSIAFCADGVRLMHRTHKDVIKQQAMTVGELEYSRSRIHDDRRNVLDELERAKAGLREVLGLIGYNDVDGPRMDALRALAGEP